MNKKTSVFFFKTIKSSVFMPRTLKKVNGHIALGESVRPLVYPLQQLKFSFEIPQIVNPYFLSLNYLICGVMPF